MAPSAPPHTEIPVGTCLTPIAETRPRIELPSFRALMLERLAIRYRFGGPAVRAFLYKLQKSLTPISTGSSTATGKSAVTVNNLTREPNSLPISSQ